MNNVKENWKGYIIVILLLLLTYTSYLLCEQSGLYHDLQTELRTTREELDRAKRNQRDSIEQLESVIRGIDKSANEAESIGSGIEVVKDRIGSDNEKIIRSRELIDDSIRILRESKRESGEAKRQSE